MASTKKQDKPSTVLEQAAPAPTDQDLKSPSSGSDAGSADKTAGGAAINEPGADPDANTTQEAGGSATELPVELARVATSTADAASADADAAGLDQLTSSTPGEVNPAQVKVYPLRSFMDEGELRRRGGPGYLVPRLHAEDLERRNLVSRTPLEE